MQLLNLIGDADLALLGDNGTEVSVVFTFIAPDPTEQAATLVSVSCFVDRHLLLFGGT
jgi:hypothetical protein